MDTVTYQMQTVGEISRVTTRRTGSYCRRNDAAPRRTHSGQSRGTQHGRGSQWCALRAATNRQCLLHRVPDPAGRLRPTDHGFRGVCTDNSNPFPLRQKSQDDHRSGALLRHHGPGCMKEYPLLYAIRRSYAARRYVVLRGREVLDAKPSWLKNGPSGASGSAQARAHRMAQIAHRFHRRVVPYPLAPRILCPKRAEHITSSDHEGLRYPRPRPTKWGGLGCHTFMSYRNA